MLACAGAAESLGGLVYRLRLGRRTPPIDTEWLKRQIEITTRGLVTALSDHDPGVRAAAATGLGIMARRAAPGLSALEQFATHKDESYAARRQAAKTLDRDRAVTLAPGLVAALEDESADVRAAAARALTQFGPDLDPQIPTLLSMLRARREKRGARRAPRHSTWPGRVEHSFPHSPGFSRAATPARAYAAILLGRIGPEAQGSINALIAVLNEPIDSRQGDTSAAIVSLEYPARCAARHWAKWGRIARQSPLWSL